MNAFASVSYTEQEKALIHAQLERLLTNAHFSNSRRFPGFLRFVVAEELAGRGELIKERTLGVEVFGRRAAYDTTADPIVRVTAAEIRKRIAQYYQEPGHSAEMRISLPPGSYVPHFEWQHAEVSAEPPAAEPAKAAVITTAEEPRSAAAPLDGIRRRSGWSVSRLLAMVLGLIVVCGAGLAYWRTRPTALDLFWAPVFSSSDAVTVCFPQSHVTDITLREAADPTRQHQLAESMNAVVVDDLGPLVSLSGLLEMHHQRYTLTGEDAASLTDLRQGPTVFLGAFDNAWTLRLTRGLRFRFGVDPEMKHFWIEDTQSPQHTRWAIDRNLQEATNNYRDYAIVARFYDPSTGRPAVIAAGIARGGTVAAGEFLTQAANLETLRARAPRDWDKKNVELVLSTEIIDGRSAPPRIEAVHFW